MRMRMTMTFQKRERGREGSLVYTTTACTISETICKSQAGYFCIYTPSPLPPLKTYIKPKSSLRSSHNEGVKNHRCAIQTKTARQSGNANSLCLLLLLVLLLPSLFICCCCLLGCFANRQHLHNLHSGCN